MKTSIPEMTRGAQPANRSNPATSGERRIRPALPLPAKVATYPSYEEIHELLGNPSRKGELNQLMEDFGLKSLPSPFDVFDASADELRRQDNAEILRLCDDIKRLAPLVNHEALSYGVRCQECGEWETLCLCEEGE